jgi:hypothetical protein
MDKLPNSPEDYSEYISRMSQNAYGLVQYSDAYRRAALNTWQLPKQRTNAIGIPLIRSVHKD